jgi:selenoprotein W-related protein
MDKPSVEIEYCRQCNYLLRAGWMAQELLFTFGEELGGLTLRPGGGGHFIVRVDGETLFSRKDAGRFPEARELKELLAARIAPGKTIGHKKPGAPAPG